MDKDKQIEKLNSIINLYKNIIEQLKNKLYQEEQIKKSYIHALYIRSKL
jgi:hypothetical protein